MTHPPPKKNKPRLSARLIAFLELFDFEDFDGFAVEVERFAGFVAKDGLADWGFV